jgi:hypothetical protein
MKKKLLKSIAAICLGITFFQTEAIAQCSGGVVQGNITPTAVIQTVPVPLAGLYFTFTATAGGVYEFSFCAAQGGSASYDTQLTIINDVTSAYAGGYNDDWCGLQSYLQWTCSTSGVYRVLVSRYFCNQNGGSPATLAYRLLPPSNDLCTGAINIGTTSTTTGSTSNATVDNALPCITTDGTAGGVWYYINGNGNQIHATLCGSAFDTRIRVYTGSCGFFTCVAGNDDGICAPQSSVDFCSDNGTVYYILVHGNGAAAGAFTLNMSETVVNPPTITQFGYSYCGSGSIQIDASGYPAYSWGPSTGLNTTTGPSVIASPPSTTTYTVTSVDPATGCNAYNNATVTVYPVPVVGATTANPNVCSGSASQLSASGASTYNWMPGNISGSPVTVNPVSTTTYTVTGTSTDGCTNTASVTVTVNPLPPVVATSSSPDVCIGSFVTLSAAGANTYNWMPGNNNNPNFNVTPNTNTTYTLTGTDGNGCVNTSTVMITVNSLPTITATASPDTVCTGNTDTLTAAGGVSYVWSSGGNNVQEVVAPSTQTTYTVTGTDANGCVNTGTVTVHALLSGPVSATAAYSAVCSGSLDILNASGASTYNWQPGNMSGSSVNINPTVTTTYTVTGSTSNGCVKSDTLTVSVNPLPTVAATASSSTFCSGTSSTLTATGASTYTWSPGNLSGNPVSVSPTASTTYTVTGTDANGCTGTGMVSLTVNPSPNVTATSTPVTSCSGNPVTITAAGAQSYLWMPGNLTGSSITVTPSTPTTYTVTGTNANGCTDTYMINISISNGPDIICYSAQTNACTNDMHILLYAIPAGGTWTGPGVSGGYFSPSVAGVGSHVLTYTYTDSNGCTNTGTTTIVVSACVGVNEIEGLGGISFFPNPNDGSFTVSIASDNIQQVKMEIIDLQGRLVYAEMLEGINSGYTKSIDVNGIANGAYYLRFSSANETFTEKLIIQK